MNSLKLTSLFCDHLYTALYGPRTLAFWAEKDNTLVDPARILWEESRSARKRISQEQQRIDIKLLCNQCGLAKILFQYKHQDSHQYPVYLAPMEDMNHLYTCPDVNATKVLKKGTDEMKSF